MSNTGQANFSGAKAFNGGGQSRSFGGLLPMGLLAFGAGSMGVALLTALTPPSVAAIGKVAEILDRVGLDKGPLMMFGVLSTAMGFALYRLEKASQGGSAATDAASFAQSNASSIELQSEILGSVQSELGQIRGELAAARQEAQDARTESNGNNGEASDPLFRLAASLDQLGAHIDKRVDKARREMIDAITGVASTAEVSAQQREEAFKNTANDIDSVRMDIADLRAQLTRVSGDVTSTKATVTTIEARLPENGPAAAPAAISEPEPLQKKVTQVKVTEETEVATSTPSENAAPSSPALPRELSDEPAPVEAEAEPAAPIPAAAAEPQYEGFQHGGPDEAETKSESKDSEPAEETPKLGVNMESLGFAEPPAPMPKPSEGLSLIDEMDEDTARQGDMTPPLFPDMGEKQ